MGDHVIIYKFDDDPSIAEVTDNHVDDARVRVKASKMLNNNSHHKELASENITLAKAIVAGQRSTTSLETLFTQLRDG